MNSIARRHHYLSQAYLGSFTDTGTKYGNFYVLKTESGECFSTSPKKVAVARDFNRLDAEEIPLDALEQSLSSFEGRVVEACQNIIHTKTFPNVKDYNSLINLICLIAVRNPQTRKSINRSREMALNLKASLLVSDEKIWTSHLRRTQEAGYVSNAEISNEEMKKFIEERRYDIKFSPGGNLRSELSAIDKLLPILGRRIWSLLLAPDSGPDFICSDHPIALNFKDSHREGPIGYGLKNTEIFFPISPKLGFYGVFENPLPQISNVKPDQVAKMNGQIAESAERHVFSIKDTFVIWYDGEIREVNCSSKIDSQR
ncbi:MAG: DUF4238 domain-containing protein [Nitrospirae bacterium]|nr:DUF4238 domain-containing protein [Nitrospirota bacterium]MDA1304929.1 DUF4238 domain-containing protein [Nitrospirota bacterium]